MSRDPDWVVRLYNQRGTAERHTKGCVYRHAWETGSQARVGIGRWITFYNNQRAHIAHGGKPPSVVYFNTTETDQQLQAVAQTTRKCVQGSGSSSIAFERKAQEVS
jgi:hypothetical protein